MAASRLQNFDALDEKSLTIRSAVSPSARIRSAARAYPIDLVAREAPTQKSGKASDTRRGTDGKIDEEASGCAMLIELCHDEAGFGNRSAAYLGITNRLTAYSHRPRPRARELRQRQVRAPSSAFERKSISGNF